MSKPSKVIAIDIDGGRLTAVSGGVRNGRLMLERCVREALPEGLDVADPVAVGAWVKAQLKAHAMTARAAVIALERSGVVVKRLEFPGTPGADDELPSMVRLAMVRQLAMPSEGAAIDYLVVGDPGESGPTNVMAAALTSDRMDWVRRFVRAAGLTLVRVTLKSTGLAAVLAERVEQRDGASLVVTFDGPRCEFMVMGDGQILFSRHADLPASVEELKGDALAEACGAAAREAKRSWVSYRMAPVSREVESVFVLADPGWGEAVGEAIGEALELPVSVVHAGDRFGLATELQHDGVHGTSSCPAHWSMPLAGVLLEQAVDRPRLNLARVWKEPDKSAGLRQRVLAAALVALLAYGGVYTWLNLKRSDLQAELADLEEREGNITKRQMAAILASARAEHMTRWSEVSPEWLEHLGVVFDAVPVDGSVILGQVNGAAETAVWYERAKGERRGAVYSADRWTMGMRATLRVGGRAGARPIAEAFRGRFIADGRYVASPVGPDEADGAFNLLLTTSINDPTSVIENNVESADSGANEEEGGAS